MEMNSAVSAAQNSNLRKNTKRTTRQMAVKADNPKMTGEFEYYRLYWQLL